MYRSNDSGCLVPILAIIAVVLVVVVLDYLFEAPNAIGIDAAIGRFYEITEAESITVVRHSNNSFLTGDMHDVTFELIIDGQHKSGRCTSATWSEMICRVYEPGGE